MKLSGLKYKSNSWYIKAICLFFSMSFFVGAVCAAAYTGEWSEVFSGWLRILTSPSPLVTDYFQLGNLAAAFFNAGMCGLACTLLMIVLKTECIASNITGYFLVVSHCFYGLNFLNMWPSILGILLFCRIMKIEFRYNLDMAMLSTAFGPFASELLFRYALGDSFEVGEVNIKILGIIYLIILFVFLGFAIPAMLPGAMNMHKGFNLYNGGLAFGLLGLFIFSFMYKTMGRTAPTAYAADNPVYELHGNSYWGFTVIFFIIVFAICIITGWYLNGKSLSGYGELLRNSGYRIDFVSTFGIPKVLINIGFYGIMIVAYFTIIIFFTEGVGVTGATMGVTLAALSFVASGQHPRNVWPIFVGYAVLSILVHIICFIGGVDVPWTLSTQGYINGVAFATGLCPIAGRYGWKLGVVAGFVCAVMCTSTSAIHGGFVLYNGGLTAGITALIMVPCLEYYYRGKKRK